MGNNPMNGIDPDGGCFDENGNPCPNMEVGSTMTGAAGYEWTMTDTGWDRSDGYGVTVTPSFGDKFRLQSYMLNKNFNSLSNNNPYPEYRWDWFEDRLSGDKFYGIGSEEYGNTRGKYGTVYGSQDYNDWLIPGGGGANLRFWSHKANTVNHMLRATRDGVGAVDQANNVASVIIEPVDNDTITYLLQAWKNGVHSGGIGGEYKGVKSSNGRIRDYFESGNTNEWDSIQKVQLYGN